MLTAHLLTVGGVPSSVILRGGASSAILGGVVGGCLVQSSVILGEGEGCGTILCHPGGGAILGMVPSCDILGRGGRGSIICHPGNGVVPSWAGAILGGSILYLRMAPPAKDSTPS